MRTTWIVGVTVLFLASFIWAAPAQAYLGPGAGLSALGSLVSLVGMFVFAILGFAWYPFKRLLAKVRRKS